MQIHYLVDNNDLYFYLSGELDQHYAKGVKEYIESILDAVKNYQTVIFDLSELTFMDSTGIGMLLGRYKKLKKSGVNCSIANPTVNVEKVLELSGIYEVMAKI